MSLLLQDYTSSEGARKQDGWNCYYFVSFVIISLSVHLEEENEVDNGG